MTCKEAKDYERVCHGTSSLASRRTSTFIVTTIFINLDMEFEQNSIWRSMNMMAIWWR